MATGQDDELRSFYIPRNVKREKKIFQIKLKNLIEGGLLGGGLAFFIMRIETITQDAKLIISLVFGLLILVFEVRGLHDCTVLGYLVKVLKYIWTRKEYDFKPLEEIYSEQKKNTGGDIRAEAYESNFARILGKFKKGKA